MGILPPLPSGGHPGKGTASRAAPGSREGETGRREPAPRRGAGTASGGAPPVCPVPLRCCAALPGPPHPSPPSLLGPGKTLRTLALKVHAMGSLAFSGLNSLLGSPLCCVGDYEAEWGRGGGTSWSLQIPWGAKRAT